MTDYNKPQYQNNDVTMMRLYEKQSKAGNMYFSATLGPARYSLVKTKFTSDQGEPVWELKISAVKKDGASASAPRTASKPAPVQRDEDEVFLSEFVG